MKQLNVGVIGVGFIGTLHIDAIRRLQGAHVLGICASNPSKLNALMEKHNIEVGYQHWKDMITDPRIDVIHNCTPNHLHDDINRAAIEAGKHIFSEKPLSLNADSAKELLDLAIEKKVAHGVNHQYRLNAAVQEIKEGVQKGDYGRPLFIRGHYLQESHTRKTDYSKRLVPETSPARALADIGSHIADIINCVMDMPIKSVFADMLTHHPYRYDPNTGYKIEVHSDDTTTVLFRLVDGTPGMLIVSKVFSGHKNDLFFAIDTEECEVGWNQQVPDRFYISRRETGNTEIFMNSRYASEAANKYITLPPGHVMGWPEALRNNIYTFYESIRNESYITSSQPYATFKDGWYTNLFIEACITSSREKRWVDIEY